MKGIPVIQKQDVTVTKSIVLSLYCGFVCEALWTKSVGVKVCCISDLYSWSILVREDNHRVSNALCNKQV